MSPVSEAKLAEITGITIDDSTDRNEVVWSLLDRNADGFNKQTGEKTEGKPVKRRNNLAIILEHDPRLQGVRWNEFTSRPEWRGRPIEDLDVSRLALWLDQVYSLNMGARDVLEALTVAAFDRPYHPVRIYLEALQWDGVPRLDSWLAAYMGAEDTPLHAAIGKRWFISAIARVMQPGCKVDTVLILVGAQGLRKSTAFKRLASPEWFSDTQLDVRNKDAYLALEGVWIYEFPELDSMRRSEASAVKAFLSASSDKFRRPYGITTTTLERQCVIVGTTNEAVFLSDATGSRRFWPVKATRSDVEGLDRDRDQLWAEAMALYSAGEQWWLTPEEEAQRAEAAEQHSYDDAWAEDISRFIDGRSEVTINEILRSDKCLDLDVGKTTKPQQMRVADVLTSLGWEKGPRRRIGGIRQYTWVPGEGA